MKKLTVLLLVSAFLIAGCRNNASDKRALENKDTLALSGTIKISGSQTLYPMMAEWGSQFSKEHPAVKFDVRSEHSQLALEELLAGKIDLAMMSRKPGNDSAEAKLWCVAVALDGVVPIISFDNPEIQPLVMKGVSKEKLLSIFTGKITTWGQVSGRNSKEPIKVYAFSDSSGTAYTWKSFLGGQDLAYKASKVQSSAAMLSHVMKEKGAIGYISVMDAYNLQTGFRKEGLYVLPLDANSNGTIEDNEQFFDKYNVISNAIETGKMATPPARALYLVAKEKPTNALIKAYIEWVLTIGQNYMPDLGYINITPQQANTSIESLK